MRKLLKIYDIFDEGGETNSGGKSHMLTNCRHESIIKTPNIFETGAIFLCSRKNKSVRISEIM